MDFQFNIEKVYEVIIAAFQEKIVTYRGFYDRELNLLLPINDKLGNYHVTLVDDKTALASKFIIPKIHKEVFGKDEFIKIFAGIIPALLGDIRDSGDKKYPLDLRNNPVNGNKHTSMFWKTEKLDHNITINYYRWSILIT